MTHTITHNKTWQWLLIITLLSVFTLPAQAAIPDTVDYQGYLADSGGSPINGTVNITFSLYNVDSGGAPLWDVTQPVTLTNGLFSVKLGGAGSPFPLGLFDNPLWLGILVASDLEMTPRIAISSAAFAFKADDALTLEGQSASSLDQSAHVTDTANPHNVTAVQTEAASSAEFILHITNDSAHHSKTISFSELIDKASDAQIPDTITINQADNADTLDGLDSTAFMSSGTDDWVNITGDTMTGNLNVLANVGIGTIAPDELLTVGDTADFLNRNIRIRSRKDVALILQSDTDNIDESDNPYIQFLQDGGVVDGVIGLSGGSDIGPDGTAMVGARANAFVIANKFSGAHVQFMTNNGVDIGNRLSITGGGNVGIGTSAPESKLTVSGGMTVGAAYNTYTLNDGKLAISGNVGIGTAAPLYKLDIRGDVESYLGYFENDNNSGAGGYAAGLLARGDAYDTVTGQGLGGIFYGVAGSDSGEAYGTYNYAYAYGSSPAYGVYSNATIGTTSGREWAFYGLGDGYFSGKVGIGTTTPTRILEVRGGENTYLGFFYNDNNTSGNAYGIQVIGSAYDTGTGWARGGYFSAQGGSTDGTAFGSLHYASANGSSPAYGVYSVANLGSTVGSEYAFYGTGDAYVSGILSKGGGAFKIDHPLDPENKYLQHSFVESPDMMNVYNGNVILDDNGEAQVSMPDWFNALNKDFRYQLTCIGGFAPVYIAQEITGNAFSIAGGQPGMKVSWMVTGIRQDAFANANRIPVEEDKKGIEAGTYLHPVAHGQSRDRSLARAQAVEMGYDIYKPR